MYSKVSGCRDSDGHRHYEVEAPPNTFEIGCTHPEDEHARCTRIKTDGEGVMILSEEGHLTYIFTTQYEGDINVGG